MDQLDTVGIVRRDHLSPEASSSSWGRCGHREAPCWRSSRFRLPLISVEPVVVLTMFSVALHDPLSTQYLWARISEDHGYNQSKTSGCGSGSGESSRQDPLQKVQHVIDLGSFVDMMAALLEQTLCIKSCFCNSLSKNGFP